MDEDPPPASKTKRGHAPMPMHACSKQARGRIVQGAGRNIFTVQWTPSKEPTHLTSPLLTIRGRGNKPSPYHPLMQCNTHTHTHMHLHTSLSNIIFTLINILEVEKKVASVYTYIHGDVFSLTLASSLCRSNDDDDVHYCNYIPTTDPSIACYFVCLS